MKTKTIALTTIFAALYFVLVNVAQPISFMQIQIRVANALLALVPLYGLGVVFGVPIGVFFANLSSPLGWIDLISVLPTFAGLVIIYLLRNKSLLLGLSIYNVILASWISFMLWYIIGLPYIISFVYVLAGLFAANVGIGYPIYKGIKKRLFKK